MNELTKSTISLARASCSHLTKRMSDRTLADYGPFFESLAPNVRYEYSSPQDSGVLIGKATVVDSISALYSRLSSVEAVEDIALSRAIDFIANESTVVALWAENTLNKQNGIASTSKEVVVIMDFTDGLIVRLRRFSQ